jgi:hypothetical protein
MTEKINFMPTHFSGIFWLMLLIQSFVEQANKREHHLSNFGLDRVSLWGRGFTL